LENINGRLDVDAEMNLKGTGCESVDWRHVTQNGNLSRDIVDVNLLLVLASTLILGSEFHGTHDQIF
jgi:hypothetical protein